MLCSFALQSCGFLTMQDAHSRAQVNLWEPHHDLPARPTSTIRQNVAQGEEEPELPDFPWAELGDAVLTWGTAISVVMARLTDLIRYALDSVRCQKQLLQALTRVSHLWIFRVTPCKW